MPVFVWTDFAYFKTETEMERVTMMINKKNTYKMVKLPLSIF